MEGLGFALEIKLTLNKEHMQPETLTLESSEEEVQWLFHARLLMASDNRMKMQS
jgi:hypothetical protein